MANLLSKLNIASEMKPIEPREIFMTLPEKEKQYEYPRDVQTEVWKKWFERRTQKNNIIKMNTGSGKTVVGLMILQSCLNEGVGPAIYVVPDNFLAAQVCREAKKLGIRATTNREDYMYTERRAILVMPIHALVNGKSVFGMRSSGNYPIGTILLDDVHACLDTITEQFSIRIPVQHELYSKVISLFADAWKQYNEHSYISIAEFKDEQKRMLLPFWIWQERAGDIYRLLSEYENDQEKNQFVFFNFPLLKETLHLCNCVITAKAIEITPAGIDISQIKSFENATRRIFMSATLSDDSVFVSSIGLKPEEIDSVITPEKANDIGDRLILFPKHLNNTLTDEQIKNEIEEISQKYNVVVIVPSLSRAKFWDPSESRIVTKENIEKAVDLLKSKHLGLLVFVNRYDGIDLPDNACRMLVLDGLPPLRSEYDKYIQSIDENSDILLREQIQRIEQGMGRGVRSNSDSCCIVLMGSQLADVLLRNKGADHFSNTTAAQFDLSRSLWALLKEENDCPSIHEIFELANYSLNREVDWIRQSKSCLSNVSYTEEAKFDNTTLALRNAFENALRGEWEKAVNDISQAIKDEQSNDSKGYLTQIKASYLNFIDGNSAQQALSAGRKLNKGILVPIKGIQYEKSINYKAQAKAVCDLTKTFKKQNEFVIYVNSVVDKLAFSPDADDFEKVIMDIGVLLGFVSTRPEKETGGQGPDNLWALGDGKYLVIECKSGATAGTISKDYCNQLGGSVRWFEQEYGAGFSCTPIMIHKSMEIDDLATAVMGMRIINERSLEHLKKQINAFSVAMTQSGNWQDEANISMLLSSYHLRSTDIINEYTAPFQNREV